MNYRFENGVIDAGEKKIRNFILGTDWWTDCDDAVAIRLLARAHKAGDICLKGIVINACMEHSVASLEGFLNAEGVQDIPIGIDLEGTDFGGNPSYQKNLVKYASRYHSNEEAENAVRLYRRLLAESIEPVEMIEIGYLQVFAALLESRGDDISEKSGMELIREKVSKVWVMAGKWDDEPGRENNFIRNMRSRAAGHIFCEKCPVPVTFLGWEIGYDVITGDCLKDGDVLYQVLRDHGSSQGRMSWDPMLVLLALTGDENAAGYHTVRGTASVNPQTGENSFKPDENGPHCYVVKKEENHFYKGKINESISFT